VTGPKLRLSSGLRTEPFAGLFHGLFS
jgi:hypothetical protein